ncbi:hypothetical protein Smp_056290 [Schistosoma mansoni]|uniref:hypothetical protein n=1 Tax=Schistosoma mansoni TaxID=6183 RepID=UPI00022DC938|nr:hypothetical protein Smp_056290 [Schistosoma mansoni]|eukprot:XP_018647577.1 hypothetical protein Smp_056290 [Schistosoma mansoni]
MKDSNDKDTKISLSKSKEFFIHYQLLMWKNFLLRKRRPGFLLAEILVPLMIPIILVGIRTESPPVNENTCHVRSINLPTMGLFSYLQSIVCNFLYRCHSIDPDSTSQQFNYTVFGNLLENISSIVGDLLTENVLSKFICGTKTANLNDLGKLMEFLKDIDFTNLIDIEKKLKRIRRYTSSSSSSSLLLSTINHMDTIETNYKINCIALDQLLRNSLLIHYTGRLRFLLNGYIFYYPVNQWTNEIMYRVMEPQRLLILLKNILKQYQLQTKPILNQLLSNTTILKQIRSMLKTCTIHSNGTLHGLIQKFCLNALLWLNPEGQNHFNETNDLLNQPMIFHRINIMIDIIIQLLDCFPLATHIYGVNNQSMFNVYMNLFKSQVHPIVQGILFNNTIFSSNHHQLNSIQNTSTIITIRQNPYIIDDTNNYKVLDHTWNPKPRNNVNDGDTKYLTSGFLDIQDLISNAIIEISNNIPERIKQLNNSWNSWTGSSSTSSSPSTSSSNHLLIGKQMKFFPTSCYKKDEFLNKIKKLLPQLLLLTWILNAMLITKYIVEEKENYIKEFTKIMGFTNTTHWLSWFSSTFIIVLPITIIITLILKYGNIFIISSIFIIFFLLISYIISIIMFCFLCSIFFQKSNLSAIVTGLFYFIIYIPIPLILMNEKWIKEEIIYITSLSNQVAFSLGLYSLLRLESQNLDTYWNDLWQPKLSDSLFSPGKSILMLWIDSILYLCMTLLIEWIISKKYNIYQSFYSRIKCQNWKIFNKHKDEPIDCIKNVIYKEDGGNVQLCVESNHECLPISISVKNLSKMYNKKSKPALDHLNIEFYTNQITSLLGHNGSGKSTLISILTGIHKPSNGLAMICGYNIHQQMNQIRTNLGYCPQHNILFEYLTVIEHIKFYAKLKGFNKEQINNEVNYFSNLLNLTNKLNDQVKTLSGGQKRKLSIAIAFVGQASVILLDEPTTGVDPYSRRSIWDLILKMKLNKTIIITTHHMDEADILGDRIAIISQGKLKCYGSSLFLKSTYGQGYYLILERHNQLLDGDSTESLHSDTLTDEDLNDIIHYLKQYIKDISLIDYNQNEMIYRIPIQNIIDGSLSQLFKQFENPLSPNDQIILPIELTSHGIISCGLTDTSLEEIFLNIADDPAMLLQDSSYHLGGMTTATDNKNDNQYETDVNKNDTSMNQIQQQHEQQMFTSTGLRQSQMNSLRQSSHLSHLTNRGPISAPPTLPNLLHRKHYYNKTDKSNDTVNVHPISNVNVPLNQPNTRQQIKAMFLKRFHYLKRSKLSLFIEFILPICVLILVLKSLQFFKKPSSNQPMIITPWLMSDENNKLPLNTFYENNLYELENPTDNLLNKSNTFKSVLNIAWNYENALKQPYGWTGIGCLPKYTLQNINAYYKTYSQCNLSNIKIIKKELTHQQMKYIRSYQSNECSCNTSCFMNSFTQYEQQPSSKILPTKDIFLNLTSFKVSDYLIRTQNQYIKQRYGGLSYHTHNYPSLRKLSKYLLNSNNLFIYSLTNMTSIYDLHACLFFLFIIFKENQFFIQSINNYFYINYPKLLKKHNMIFMIFMKKLDRIKSNNDHNNNHQRSDINKSINDNDNHDEDNNNSEDEDVHAERLRIMKADKEGYLNSLCSVAVINLTKFFPLKKKPSVNRLTFAVRPGECFGLLGVNGAGKTTAFNMITGKLHPSMGTVYVNGFNVVTQTKNALKNLGYCPQFDAVHDLLTGRETLSLYARLRGFPENEISKTVSELLQNMGLSPYADRITSAYSGGNRRKLSTAIAIIGKPQVILLDEPTSGMDPIGKRFMWDQIILLIKEGRSIILTTHSMEECEALCQYIGIMINGQLKCFGTIQHLKNRFGNGYQVDIRLNHLVTNNQINQLKNEFHLKFPNSILNELQSYYYKYQMDKNIQLSLLFTLLNQMQMDHIIEHYSVRQTTLDQVFVNFSSDEMNHIDNVNNIEFIQ